MKDEDILIAGCALGFLTLTVLLGFTFSITILWAIIHIVHKLF
jgi:hypothetical protein